MHTAIDYILCYGTSFLIGAFVGGLVIGYLYTERHRKHMIVAQRMKQIRRDNGRRKHAKS